MLDIDQCIFYWRTYLDNHEDKMTDNQVKTMLHTIKYLAEYKKLQEEVKPALDLTKIKTE